MRIGMGRLQFTARGCCYPATERALRLHEANQGQRACAKPSAQSLEDRPLARGNEGRSRLALCRAARAPVASRHVAHRTVAGGMAADRVARRQGRAAQILALDIADRHVHRNARRYGETALAHRARLPGLEAGDRSRPLRRARLARLPPPRDALDRSLRIPGLRKESDSPLSANPPRALARHPAAARGLQAAWPRPSGLSATHQSRSPRFAGTLPSRLPSACRAVHAGCEKQMSQHPHVYDTVRLGFEPRLTESE